MPPPSSCDILKHRSINHNSTQCWGKREERIPFQKKNCKYHRMMFFKSSLETRIPLPNNNMKFNTCLASQTIHWLMPLEVRSFTGTCLSFIPPLQDTKTLPSKSKWKTSQVIGTVLVLSSPLNVTQWLRVLPWATFFKAAVACGQVSQLPTQHFCTWQQSAISCLSYTFLFQCFSNI